MDTLKVRAKATNAKMSETLKDIRGEKRFTMRALADVLGTPHSFIGKTEQQSRRLDVGEFVHYCKALKVDPVVVFKQLL